MRTGRSERALEAAAAASPVPGAGAAEAAARIITPLALLAEGGQGESAAPLTARVLAAVSAAPPPVAGVVIFTPKALRRPGGAVDGPSGGVYPACIPGLASDEAPLGPLHAAAGGTAAAPAVAPGAPQAHGPLSAAPSSSGDASFRRRSVLFSPQRASQPQEPQPTTTATTTATAAAAAAAAPSQVQLLRAGLALRLASSGHHSPVTDAELAFAAGEAVEAVSVVGLPDPAASAPRLTGWTASPYSPSGTPAAAGSPALSITSGVSASPAAGAATAGGERRGPDAPPPPFERVSSAGQQAVAGAASAGISWRGRMPSTPGGSAAPVSAASGSGGALFPAPATPADSAGNLREGSGGQGTTADKLTRAASGVGRPLPSLKSFASFGGHSPSGRKLTRRSSVLQGLQVGAAAVRRGGEVVQRNFWPATRRAVIVCLFALYATIANSVCAVLRCESVSLAVRTYLTMDVDSSGATLRRHLPLYAAHPVPLATLRSCAAFPYQDACTDAVLSVLDSTVPASVAAYNPYIVCYEGSHRAAAGMAWLVLVVYLLAMPLVLGLALRFYVLQVLTAVSTGHAQASSLRDQAEQPADAQRRLIAAIGQAWREAAAEVVAARTALLEAAGDEAAGGGRSVGRLLLSWLSPSTASRARSGRLQVALALATRAVAVLFLHAASSASPPLNGLRAMPTPLCAGDGRAEGACPTDAELGVSQEQPSLPARKRRLALAAASTPTPAATSATPGRNAGPLLASAASGPQSRDREAWGFRPSQSRGRVHAAPSHLSHAAVGSESAAVARGALRRLLAAEARCALLLDLACCALALDATVDGVLSRGTSVTLLSPPAPAHSSSLPQPGGVPATGQCSSAGPTAVTVSVQSAAYTSDPMAVALSQPSPVCLTTLCPLSATPAGTGAPSPRSRAGSGVGDSADPAGVRVVSSEGALALLVLTSDTPLPGESAPRAGGEAAAGWYGQSMASATRAELPSAPQCSGLRRPGLELAPPTAALAAPMRSLLADAKSWGHLLDGEYRPSAHGFKLLNLALLLAMSLILVAWGTPATPAGGVAQLVCITVPLAGMLALLLTLRPHRHEDRWNLLVDGSALSLAALQALVDFTNVTALRAEAAGSGSGGSTRSSKAWRDAAVGLAYVCLAASAALFVAILVAFVMSMRRPRHGKRSQQPQATAVGNRVGLSNSDGAGLAI